jgi:hypothetical protein
MRADRILKNTGTGTVYFLDTIGFVNTGIIYYSTVIGYFNRNVNVESDIWYLAGAS